nr:hypothetical protein [Tanacetum cinerariifolium]
NCTVKPRKRDVAYLQTQLLIAQKEEAGIQLQAEEFDLMATAADLDEIKEVNANCILIANLQQASTSDSSGTESKEQETSSRLENYAHADDADIRHIYDEEPMVKVQTTVEINVFATGQQHTEQSEFSNK